MGLDSLKQKAQASLVSFDAFRLDLEKLSANTKQEIREKEALTDHLKNVLADLIILADFVEDMESWQVTEPETENDPLTLLN